MPDSKPRTNLDQRYLDLVTRFRSQWTFLQFLEGMEKTFATLDHHHGPSTLGTAKSDLKGISEILNRNSTPKLRSPQDDADTLLDATAALLLAEDSRVSPGQQRQFFFLVTGYQKEALGRILAFYLLEFDKDLWSDEEIDKVDFLASSCVADAVAGAAQPDWQQIDAFCGELIELRDRLLGPSSHLAGEASPAPPTMAMPAEEAERPDEISELIVRFRKFKHRLGPSMLEPALWSEILRTNWRIKNAVRSVVKAEEGLLRADLDRLFSIEERASLPLALDTRVADLRQRVAELDQDFQRGNVRLEEIIGLRQETTEALLRLEQEISAVDAGVRQVKRSVPVSALRNGASAPKARTALALSGLVGADFFAPALQSLLATVWPLVAAKEEEKARVQAAIASLDLSDQELELLRQVLLGDGSTAVRDVICLEAAAARIHLVGLSGRLERLEEIEMSAGEREAVLHAARRALSAASTFLDSLRRETAEAVAAGDGSAEEALKAARFPLEARRADLWLLLNSRLR